MTKSLDIVLKAYEAWNRDDRNAWLQMLHPEVEFHTSGIWPDFDPIYRGHEGAAEFWRRLHEAWEEFRIDVEAADEERDFLVLALRFRATGAGSGVQADLKFANAIRLRDGLQAEIVSRRTTDEAREALAGSQDGSNA